MAAKSKKANKVRIQLVIDESINELLDQLAERERRTKSAVVELSILSYAEKSKTEESEVKSQPQAPEAH